MISIEKINNNIFEKTLDFLVSVPSIENVDVSILNNACVAMDNGSLVGCISYEEFGSVGLIRYFVFKKALDLNDLTLLIDKLKEEAINNSMKEFVCIAENNQIKELFTSLDFKIIDKSKVYIDEEKIENTIFKQSTFLKKQLV